METVQQNGRFTLFSSKFHSNIYSILFDFTKVAISLTKIDENFFLKPAAKRKCFKFLKSTCLGLH